MNLLAGFSEATCMAIVQISWLHDPFTAAFYAGHFCQRLLNPSHLSPFMSSWRASNRRKLEGIFCFYLGTKCCMSSSPQYIAKSWNRFYDLVHLKSCFFIIIISCSILLFIPPAPATFDLLLMVFA